MNNSETVTEHTTPLIQVASPSFLACSALASFIFLLVLRSKWLARSLPPGPKRWPIVGSALSVPKEREWLEFERWAHQHDSDVLYYNSWGQSFVVISSLQAAIDLFEKKSSLYSDRPRMPMLTDLCGWGWDFAFMPYADQWKLARKMFTQHFRQSASVAYRDEEARCGKELLRDILRDPDGLYRHARLTFGKLIMSITYGIDVRSPEDMYITNAERALSALNATGNVGTYLVDFIPWLKYVPEWLPGGHFQREARVWREATVKMAYKPFETVKAAMHEGTARTSILSSLLEEYGEKMTPEVEYAIVSAAGTAYEAASETTWSATLSSILAMVMHPEIQAKAHAELDRVVGTDRFPDFSDQPKLPYISAICKEALRWRPGLPLAVMHRVTQDDNYKGYHIPGGSTVVINSWAILHDETTFPDPDIFSPERYLDANDHLDPHAPEPTAAFGFGRRSCPGMYMAQDTLWIVVALLLWAFKFERAVDERGNTVDVTGEYTFGVVSFPTPFECSIRPRTEGIRELVQAES